MEKLYYKDQYIKDFTANIVELVEKEGKYHVALDKSAFFPGGGGQPCDSGFIDNKNVVHVYEENGIVYHVMDEKPMVLQEVSCSIDWDKRFDGMQQHLGQHVLSGCFFKHFNANTTGFHLGKEFSTVDIKGYLSEDVIRECEKLANKYIYSNLEVEFLVPSEEELKEIKLRRDLPNTDEQIRVVHIKELDINACCGVHPNRTLELQAIKIKRWEKHKESTRIEFLAGKRAIEDYLFKGELLSSFYKELSCGEDDAIKTVKNILCKNEELVEKTKKLTKDLQEYVISKLISEAESIGEYKVIKYIANDMEMRDGNKLCSKIVETEKSIILLGIYNLDKCGLIFMKSKDVENVNMNTILKDSLGFINGKGGGNELCAQGTGSEIKNLEEAINNAYCRLV